MPGDIREISPQLLFFRRPGGRRVPHLPPCRGEAGKGRDALALLPSGRRGKGRRVRALHRIVKETAADPKGPPPARGARKTPRTGGQPARPSVRAFPRQPPTPR